MFKRILIAGAVAGAMLAGCGGGAGDAAPGDRQAGQRTIVPPQADGTIAFRTVAKEGFSGVSTPRQVVVKDAAAWSALWAEHTRTRTPAPPLPEVDFARQMLVGVFAGDRAAGCFETSVLRTVRAEGKLVVEYEERDITPVAVCLAMLSQPMHLVAVERTDAPVEFVKLPTGMLSFRTVDQTSRSLILAPRKVVVRDSTAFQALWAEHAGPGAKAPEVDFTTHMVAGVFLGTQPNGCYGTGIEQVSRSATRITVRHVNTEPGPASPCTTAIVTPAHLVTMERSDLPVEFATEIRTLQ